MDYRRRIDFDSRQVWQRVRNLTNYRTNLGIADGNASLAEVLNLFAHFEMEQPYTATHHPAAHSNFTLTVEEDEVRYTLWAINPRKAS